MWGLLTANLGWGVWEPARIQGPAPIPEEKLGSWGRSSGHSVSLLLTRLPQWLWSEWTPLLDVPVLLRGISIARWLSTWTLKSYKPRLKSKLFIYSIYPWVSYFLPFSALVPHLKMAIIALTFKVMTLKRWYQESSNLLRAAISSQTWWSIFQKRKEPQPHSMLSTVVQRSAVLKMLGGNYYGRQPGHVGTNLSHPCSFDSHPQRLGRFWKQATFKWDWNSSDT